MRTRGYMTRKGRNRDLIPAWELLSSAKAADFLQNSVGAARCLGSFRRFIDRRVLVPLDGGTVENIKGTTSLSDHVNTKKHLP